MMALRVTSTFFGSAEPLCRDHLLLSHSTMRINAVSVRCSDTAAPQPQEMRTPSVFRRGLVVPSKLLLCGIASHVSAATRRNPSDQVHMPTLGSSPVRTEQRCQSSVFFRDIKRYLPEDWASCF